MKPILGKYRDESAAGQRAKVVEGRGREPTGRGTVGGGG